MTEAPDSPLRAWRRANGFSLKDVCDSFVAEGFERPSLAKLSRIERDQDAPPEMITQIQAITGLAPEIIRPDLAKIFAQTSVKEPLGNV